MNRLIGDSQYPRHFDFRGLNWYTPAKMSMAPNIAEREAEFRGARTAFIGRVQRSKRARPVTDQTAKYEPMKRTILRG